MNTDNIKNYNNIHSDHAHVMNTSTNGWSDNLLMSALFLGSGLKQKSRNSNISEFIFSTGKGGWLPCPN